VGRGLTTLTFYNRRINSVQGKSRNRSQKTARVRISRAGRGPDPGNVAGGTEGCEFKQGKIDIGKKGGAIYYS